MSNTLETLGLRAAATGDQIVRFYNGTVWTHKSILCGATLPITPQLEMISSLSQLGRENKCKAWFVVHTEHKQCRRPATALKT